MNLCTSYKLNTYLLCFFPYFVKMMGLSYFYGGFLVGPQVNNKQVSIYILLYSTNEHHYT